MRAVLLPGRTLRYTLAAVLALCGIAGSGLLNRPPPVSPQRAARLARGALLAYYRLGSIPRGDRRLWDTGSAELQQRIMRQVLPGELAVLRRRLARHALWMDLRLYGSESDWAGGQDFCCDAVRDVDITSITGTRGVVHVAFTDQHRRLESEPPPDRPNGPLAWRGAWQPEEIGMTLKRIHGRYYCTWFTASWAEGFPQG